MRLLRSLFASPLFHIVFITILIAVVFAHTAVIPQDDHFAYQQFIRTLASGSVDFSIPGFHGSSFLALPLYLVTGSELSNIIFQISCALLLPIAAWFAGFSLLRDRLQALLFTYAVALMPFLFFVAFRGFTFPSFTLLLLITLWLRGLNSRWAWLPWGIAMTIKPFALALMPLFLVWTPAVGPASARGRGKEWMLCALGLAIPGIYVIAEYLQIGHIIVGAHAAIDQSNVFVWQRFPLNALHGVQMLFSVHNFYFPDAARTGVGNLTHGSPVLMVLGLFSLLYPRETGWKDWRLARVLLLCATIAFVLAALLDHMDHFYLETVSILFTLAAMPLLARHLLLVPLALITLHFQFFYLYLLWKDSYFHDQWIFGIPVAIDGVAAVVTVLIAVERVLKVWNVRKVRKA